MPSDSKKHPFSWRGSRKIGAKLPNLHALRHVCGIGGHTRTEKCLWRFSLQMHSNEDEQKHQSIQVFDSKNCFWEVVFFEKKLKCQKHFERPSIMQNTFSLLEISNLSEEELELREKKSRLKIL